MRAWCGGCRYCLALLGVVTAVAFAFHRHCEEAQRLWQSVSLCPSDTPLSGRTPHPTRPPPGHLLLKEKALGGVSPQAMRARCGASHHFSAPLGVVFAAMYRYSTVIASQWAHWRGDRRECLWCNPFLLSFGHAPVGADTSSDPAYAGPPSPQGEGFGRRTWYSQYRRGGHRPSAFTTM